jgi:hypothetical protein
MMPSDDEPTQTFAIPSSAAEAWAEVYLDVAEKLDVETLASSQSSTNGTEMPVVTNYITCDAPIDFPIPSIDMLVERLGQLYDGTKPVAAKALASSFGLSEGSIGPVLRHAREMNVIKEIHGVGWIPLKT